MHPADAPAQGPCHAPPPPPSNLPHGIERLWRPCLAPVGRATPQPQVDGILYEDPGHAHRNAAAAQGALDYYPAGGIPVQDLTDDLMPRVRWVLGFRVSVLRV